MTTAQLMWGVLFGAIGAGYLVYAKRQRAIAPLVAGIALIVVPYVIENTVALVIVSAVLAAVPWLWRG